MFRNVLGSAAAAGRRRRPSRRRENRDAAAGRRHRRSGADPCRNSECRTAGAARLQCRVKRHQESFVIAAVKPSSASILCAVNRRPQAADGAIDADRRGAGLREHCLREAFDHRGNFARSRESTGRACRACRKRGPGRGDRGRDSRRRSSSHRPADRHVWLAGASQSDSQRR